MKTKIMAFAISCKKIVSVSFAIILSLVFTYFMMKSISVTLNNKYLISETLALAPILYWAYIIMLANYLGGNNEIKKS